jgi:hypothetical protein
VVTPASKVYSLSTLINYSIANYWPYYYAWGKSVSKFKQEIRYITYKDKLTNPRFNPFKVTSFFNNRGNLFVFSQSVKNFYIEDELTSTSSTIAECALFLKQESNKTNFFIEKT